MLDPVEEPVRESLVDNRHTTVFRGTYCVLKNVSLSILINCSNRILGPNSFGNSTLKKLLT